MGMFILETMVSLVELEGVSAACVDVSALPLNFQNLASSVDTFYSCLCALEATSGLEVGGGANLSKNTRRNQNRRNSANVGNSSSGIVDIP